ncbi:MAG: peptidoglycan-binding protein [Clostridiales bacterium]|nr:peptidoglycan-binding protein [Clostridiales bacterium]
MSASERLSGLRYLPDAVDAPSELAVVNFQKANGLDLTGTLDEVTLAALFSDEAISLDDYLKQSASGETTDLYFSDAGSDVYRLKKRLNALGYYDAELNEQYDLATAAAVARFQMANGLDINGDAFGATVRRLYSSFAVEYAASQKHFEFSLGDNGHLVKQIQDILMSLGYYSGNCTGVYGEATFEAVKTFQRANDFEPNGVWQIEYTVLAHNSLVVSKDTAEANSAEKVIEIGYEGYEVFDLENALYSLGYFSGEVDEDFDERTLYALKLFQEANGLTPTGSYDSETRKALQKNSRLTDYTQFKQISMDKEVGPWDSGFAVRLMTTQLKRLGYPLDITDLLDEKTDGILIEFQKAEGLSPSGRTDAATRTRLYEGDCMPYTAASKVLEGIVTAEAREARRQALEILLSEVIDKPYSAGMTGPDSFGAGGLTYFCMQTAGIEIPPTCALQYEFAFSKESFSQETSEIKQFSIVFFQSDETVYSGIAKNDTTVVYSSPSEGSVIALPINELVERYTFLGTVYLVD